MSALESGDHVASVTKLPTTRVSDAPLPAIPVETGPSLAQRAADIVVPPDIWSERRPSLRDLYLYGVYGRWTQVDGPVRFAGALYATVVAFPFHAVGYLACWIVERPSRLFVAATVAALTYLAF